MNLETDAFRKWWNTPGGEAMDIPQTDEHRRTAIIAFEAGSTLDRIELRREYEEKLNRLRDEHRIELQHEEDRRRRVEDKLAKLRGNQ